jgi:transcription elongation factor Elf1
MVDSRWQELLKEWTKHCPQCGQSWLIVSMRQDSLHICKACGNEFVIELSAGTEKPDKERAA